MFEPASQPAHRDAPGEGSAEELPQIEKPRAAALVSTWPRRVAVAALGIAVGALLTIVAFTIVEQHLYAGRVLPGVEIDGVSAGGRREVAVYDRVTRLGVTLAQIPVRVRIGKHELSASPTLLELAVDARATARAAIGAGRSGNPFAEIAGTALRWFRPDRLPLRVEVDRDRLEGVLDGWAAETDGGEREGALRFSGSRVIEVEPRSGSGMVRSRARAALVKVLAGAARPVVDLPVGTIRPRVDSRAVAAAAARARTLLAGNTTLVVGSTTVVLTPSQLATALDARITGHALVVTIDPSRLHAALGDPLARLEQLPVDAQFEVTHENTVNVNPSRDGHEVDMNALAAAILRGRRHVVAPLEVVKPRHGTKWARGLGIAREVSSFTTQYPAGEARVLNIHRGADLLNNTVVEPGKVFSLNQAVGARTAKRGFVTAPVFAQGEFFDDYGGGVSQLATTTYNTAFFGGYADVTHQPHTIYISRYPPGREATVNYGVIDLQFRDDTRHGILIRAYYGSTSITVTLYGDTDSRTAHEENRAESNPVPVADVRIQCPASKIVDPNDVCATLGAGETQQVSTGDSGFDVAFDRVIDTPGRPSRREHYTWHYTMLPNQILVGSGISGVPASSSDPNPSP